MVDQFKSLDDVGWYGSAYMLTLCSFQLIYGRIYTFFSLKWCFLATIFLFELGSLVSGVSTSSEALIVGRAIQGLGASGKPDFNPLFQVFQLIKVTQAFSLGPLSFWPILFPLGSGPFTQV